MTGVHGAAGNTRELCNTNGGQTRLKKSRQESERCRVGPWQRFPMGEWLFITQAVLLFLDLKSDFFF